MKRIFAALTASLLLVAMLSSVALASNGATTTQFSASYLNIAQFDCSGAHVVKTSPKVSVKDSETCLLTGDTTGFVAGTFTSTYMVGTQGWGFLPPYNFDGYGNAAWGSDYDGAVATSWTITSVDNGDGTFTWTIVAYYAS